MRESLRTLRAVGVSASGEATQWEGRALLILTLVLVTFGLLAVYSASAFMAQAKGLPDSYFLMGQATRAGIGLVVLWLASLIDYRIYRRLAWPAIIAVGLLLVVLLLPLSSAIAPRVNGARRWLDLGVMFQPSELAKLAVIIWTAALAVRKQDRLRSLRYGLVPFLVILGPICLLILAEPHFSAAALTAVIAATLIFCAGGRVGHFVFLGLSSIPLLWDQVMNTGYRTNRVLAFLNPAATASDIGYQLRQSLIAVGSGGAFGVGFGESRQKLFYLPEPHNDFIFSIIAEEWGFIGAALLVMLFVAWSLIGLRIADTAPDLFGRLLAIGITMLVAVAAFSHVGVAIGLLPTTGVNLPFLSAGGTNLVLALGATGILLNIAKRRRC
jgi:cell division protein FtsW